MSLWLTPRARVETRFPHPILEPAGGLAALCKPSLREVGYQYRSTWQGPHTPRGEDWYAFHFAQPTWVDAVGSGE